MVVISLGVGLLLPSSGLPERIGRGTRALCLALLQTGVTVPQDVTILRGGLLPHLFTLARTKRAFSSLSRWRSVFCGPFQGLLPPGVTRRPPLWSPDFPPWKTFFKDLPEQPPLKPYPSLLKNLNLIL